VGRLLLARSFVLGACVAGCATLAGINDGNDGPGSSGSVELPVRDGGPGSSEGGASSDALASCTRGNAADGTSRLHAPKVALDAPVNVNGDPAEWACVDRLDFSTGGRAVGPAPGHDIAEIAMQWDELHLYFLARVTTDSPGGTAVGDQIFKNDSVHLILTGPNPQPAAGYRASDHQIVFDYMSFVADYGGGLTRPSTSGVAAAAGPFTSQNGVLTYVVEARIEAAIVGRPSGFKQGERVRLNFQINDNAAAAYRIWFWESAVCKAFTGCDRGAGASEPYCDPQCTGEVELR
jgi:hypothetical protein